MVVDLVSFRVKPDRVHDFERHNEEWVRLMRRTRGFVTHSLMRNVERPGEFVATVRWVSRDYRDRFHAADDAERRALHQQGRDLLEAPPASVLLETL
jgi:heme-degrading monooxygenase HmoA